MPSGLSPVFVREVKKMGLIPTVAEDGDYVLGRDVVEKEVRGEKG